MPLADIATNAVYGSLADKFKFRLFVDCLCALYELLFLAREL
jgi:hypothetical protein